MAIDTPEKRRNISGIHANIVPGVTPEVAKDQGWRQQVGFGYSGISATAITTALIHTLTNNTTGHIKHFIAGDDNVTFKHGTGNILLLGSDDLAMLEGDMISLRYNGANWKEIARHLWVN